MKKEKTGKKGEGTGLKKRVFFGKWVVRAVSVLLVSAMLLLQVSATETAEVYPYDYAFEEFWYEDAGEAATFTKSIGCKGCLLMEASTGKVLFAENENAALPIASVTKVMATLLIMEAIDGGRISLSDTVTVSERAASMGGSQVFLEPGEQMTVDDLLKSLIVVSANDATVALAEAVYGSEEAFIAEMNAKAEALGLENTHFVNTNGLPAEGHHSSALDVALTTRELLKHETVLNYTNIWMDTIRGGAFGLANTNKLIRFYQGANGMKTGFTSEAGYCLSGTAKRDGMQLIAVVLGAETSADRFALAKQMLDFGFANYTLGKPVPELPESVQVEGGEKDYVNLECDPPSLLLGKGAKAKLTQELSIPEKIEAPVQKGAVIGTLTFLSDGVPIASVDVRTGENVKKIGFSFMLHKILTLLFGIF